MARQNRAPGGGVDDLRLAVVAFLEQKLNAGVQIDAAGRARALDFVDVAKAHAFAFGAVAHARHIINAEHDVLRRHHNRLAVGRRQ